MQYAGETQNSGRGEGTCQSNLGVRTRHGLPILVSVSGWPRLDSAFGYNYKHNLGGAPEVEPGRELVPIGLQNIHLLRFEGFL